MLNKNYSISKNYYQYVKGVSNNPRKLELENLEQEYLNVLNEQIIPTFEHQGQIEVCAYRECSDVRIIVTIPILLLENKTYYFTEAWLEYLIDKELGIVYESSAALRLHRNSLKPYKKSTIMKFHNYYNDYLDMFTLSI